jgi:deoxyribodipyrimidine photo-lyase
LFRRDLRLEDNLGLLTALEESEQVIPAFIFDPRQINRAANEYFSEAAFSFLLTSLQELDQALQARGSRLYIFEGAPQNIVTELLTRDSVTAVYCNADYTPFARKRDGDIRDACNEPAIPFTRVRDAILSPIEDIRTGQDKLYTVFTPFMRNASQHLVAAPRKNNFSNYYTDALKTTTVSLDSYHTDNTGRELLHQGGRSEGLAILGSPDWLSDYKIKRNFAADPDSTSTLSAHHKFGTISIRETYHTAVGATGKGSQFLSELYWRDFYYYIAYHFPIVFERSFLNWATHLEWENDETHYAAWCQGRTGVPMVDAGMRQLNHTGWMHNRLRMVVASYLTKNLLIDWRWGERYFATKLVDYDPSQNNGGWQWSASVGADPRPLRIFNAVTQATKYDPDATYIKRWLPELRDVPDRTLTDGKTADFSVLAGSDSNYPAPLVDLKETYHRTRARYSAARSAFDEAGTARQ